MSYAEDSEGIGDDVGYRVINCGNGRQEVFHKDKDYEAFLKLMKAAKERKQLACVTSRQLT